MRARTSGTLVLDGQELVLVACAGEGEKAWFPVHTQCASEVVGQQTQPEGNPSTFKNTGSCIALSPK